jgi:hypothetical protein
MYDPNTEFRFNSYIGQMVRDACASRDTTRLRRWLDSTIDRWEAEAERGDGFTWAADAASALEQIREALPARVPAVARIDCEEDMTDALDKLTDEQLTFTREDLRDLLLLAASNAADATTAMLQLHTLGTEEASLAIGEGEIRAAASAVRWFGSGNDADESGFCEWLDTLGEAAN